MQPSRTCQHCGTIFENIKGRVFSNHVRWCQSNPNRNNTENIQVAVAQAFDDKLGESTKFQVVCKRCAQPFVVEERAKQFPKKNAYFCSRSCANARKHTCQTKDKIRKSVDSYNRNNPKTGKQKLEYRKTCETCQTVFVTGRVGQRFCSIPCAAKTRIKKPDSLEFYRRQAAFNFSLKNYPDEFDFSLIEKYGWYSPTNKRNNLGGVSRDHMVSVRYGYDNNVDPQILAHPANCRLVLHNQNVSKHTACLISLDDLKEGIQEWDAKYAP